MTRTELDRRSVIRGASAGGALLILGCGTGSSNPATGEPMAIPGCLVRPQQTAGPFPNKTALDRSDIRSEPGTMAPKPGLPLRVVIRVGQVAAGACRGYQGVAVDLWQCDAAGVYSGYAEQGTPGLNYLRGYQITDGTGSAEFLSIFPGSYPGRAVHLHFAVRTNPAGAGSSFISQLYFPEDVVAEVFSQPPYSAGRPQSNSSDSIFNAGGSNLIPRMSKSDGGWLAEFDLGLV
jgi:protocatechuate 3,4-dioxygenase beta subunit